MIIVFNYNKISYNQICYHLKLDNIKSKKFRAPHKRNSVNSKTGMIDSTVEFLIFFNLACNGFSELGYSHYTKLYKVFFSVIVKLTYCFDKETLYYWTVDSTE